MRMTLTTLAALALLVSATALFAETTILRTGLVAGVPGSCSGSDDSFRFSTPNPTCGQPILPTPFTYGDFAAACEGTQAVVINPAAPPWVAGLDCDPEARWISTGLMPGSCYGVATSALYCAPFTVASHCTVADSIRICWAVDDFLGDVPSFPGANPGGIYINGVDLGAAFSGPGSNPQYTAVAYGVSLFPGTNHLSVYQRDAGCGLGGLILSATVYTSCDAVPTESSTWGTVKSTFR